MMNVQLAWAYHPGCCLDDSLDWMIRQGVCSKIRFGNCLGRGGCNCKVPKVSKLFNCVALCRTVLRYLGTPVLKLKYFTL